MTSSAAHHCSAAALLHSTCAQSLSGCNNDHGTTWYAELLLIRCFRRIASINALLRRKEMLLVAIWHGQGMNYNVFRVRSCRHAGPRPPGNRTSGSMLCLLAFYAVQHTTECNCFGSVSK